MTQSVLDTNVQQDGDAAFAGFRSRLDAAVLEQGLLAMARNVRLSRGRAEVRKGLKHLAGNILDSWEEIKVFDETPDAPEWDWILPDEDHEDGTPKTDEELLAEGHRMLREEYSGDARAVGRFSSPRSGKTEGKEFLAVFLADLCWLWREEDGGFLIPLPDGEVIEAADTVQVIQAFDRLIVLRGRETVGNFAEVELADVWRASGGKRIRMRFAEEHDWLEPGLRLALSGMWDPLLDRQWEIRRVLPDGVVEIWVENFRVSEVPEDWVCEAKARAVKAPVSWDGDEDFFERSPAGVPEAGASYGTIPGSGIGCYFNNRLLVASGRDEVLASDILDYETFDIFFNAFRCNVGSADSLVALHPMAQSDLLAFMRTSIYRIQVDPTAQSLAEGNSFVELLTSEVGCRAPRSIVTAGPFIYFLADQGVYAIDATFQDYKVRGRQVPLSEQIADQIERITPEFAHRCWAAWHDNRYILAAPVDGAEWPNAIFVWCALTQEWESVDDFGDLPLVERLVVGEWRGKMRVYGVGHFGTIWVLEESEAGDEVTPEVFNAVDAEILTRNYAGQFPEGKRFLWAYSRMNALTTTGCAEAAVTVEMGEPDVTYDLRTVKARAGDTVAWRGAIRAYAHQCQIRVRNKGKARWAVRSMAVDFTRNHPEGITRTTR